MTAQQLLITQSVLGITFGAALFFLPDALFYQVSANAQPITARVAGLCYGFMAGFLPWLARTTEEPGFRYLLLFMLALLNLGLSVLLGIGLLQQLLTERLWLAALLLLFVGVAQTQYIWRNTFWFPKP